MAVSSSRTARRAVRPGGPAHAGAGGGMGGDEAATAAQQIIQRRIRACALESGVP